MQPGGGSPSAKRSLSRGVDERDHGASALDGLSVLSGYEAAAQTAALERINRLLLRIGFAGLVAAVGFGIVQGLQLAGGASIGLTLLATLAATRIICGADAST